MTEAPDIHWGKVDEAYIIALGRYTLASSNLEHVASLIANDCLAALEEDVLIKLRNLMKAAQ